MLFSSPVRPQPQKFEGAAHLLLLPPGAKNPGFASECRSASGGRTATPTHTATPDTTRRSCLCRVWCADVNWTIALTLNVFRLQTLYFFLSPTVLSCRESSSHRRSGRDRDKTVCRVWCGGVN